MKLKLNPHHVLFVIARLCECLRRWILTFDLVVWRRSLS